jgi:hypothetical protein
MLRHHPTHRKARHRIFPIKRDTTTAVTEDHLDEIDTPAVMTQ